MPSHTYLQWIVSSKKCYAHRALATKGRPYSSTTTPQASPLHPADQAKPEQQTSRQPSEQGAKKKTMAEQDDELRRKLEGISGQGGAAGLELEDGKPVAMKRGVRENMFRLI